jgi:hypothetical protein
VISARMTAVVCVTTAAGVTCWVVVEVVMLNSLVWASYF